MFENITHYVFMHCLTPAVLCVILCSSYGCRWYCFYVPHWYVCVSPFGLVECVSQLPEDESDALMQQDAEIQYYECGIVASHLQFRNFRILKSEMLWRHSLLGSITIKHIPGSGHTHKSRVAVELIVALAVHKDAIKRSMPGKSTCSYNLSLQPRSRVYGNKVLRIRARTL
jgi:hypothetical protein